MQETIESHLNPMGMKRSKIFTKKSKLSELSFFSTKGPSLQITNASHRFSHSKQKRKSSAVDRNTSEERQSIFSMGSKNKHLYTGYKNRQKRKYSDQKTQKYSRLKKSAQKGHLMGILQTVETNNKMIKELFGYDQEISLIKQEINKTVNMYKQMETVLTPYEQKSIKATKTKPISQNKHSKYSYHQNQNPRQVDFDLTFIQQGREQAQPKVIKKTQTIGQDIQRPTDNQKQQLLKRVKATNRNIQKQQDTYTLILPPSEASEQGLCQRCRCNTIR